MFGADTSLVFDALQMIAVAAAFTGGAVYLIMRRKRKTSAPTSNATGRATTQDNLEERVRVLERIATDPATRLSNEFEKLEKEDQAGKEHV